MHQSFQLVQPNIEIGSRSDNSFTTLISRGTLRRPSLEHFSLQVGIAQGDMHSQKCSLVVVTAMLQPAAIRPASHLPHLGRENE